jgi:hypothetical protein
MRLLILVISLVLTSGPLFGDRADTIKNLVSQGVFEDSDQKFSSVAESGLYIKRFSLGEEELPFIGSWGLDSYTQKISDDSIGMGISVKFLPNRYFVSWKSTRAVGTIEYVVGQWKVDRHRLQIRLLARLIRISDNTEELSKMYRVEPNDTIAYYTILSTQQYPYGFVNDYPFRFFDIPIPFLEFYSIHDNDRPRFRVLFDETGIPPGDIRKDSRTGKILLSPTAEPSYFLSLVTVWDN